MYHSITRTRTVRLMLTAIITATLTATWSTTAEAAPATTAPTSHQQSTGPDSPEPEFMGIPLRDWCTYTVMDAKAPVYDESNTRATRTGTLYRGDKITAQCHAKDLWDGGRYTGSCGTTNTWLLYTSNGGTRYVPWTCFYS